MRQPIRLPELTPEAVQELDTPYRTTHDVRLRTRALMILLAAEQHLVASEIAKIVRVDPDTVVAWLKRYLAEGINGLADMPRSGSPVKVTPEYRELLVQAVRQRPRSLGQPYSIWTLQRLADYLAEQTGIRVEAETVRCISRQRHCAEPAATQDHQPGFGVRAKNKTVEDVRDHLKPGEVFHYAGEFNVSWLPTLRAIWSPRGQQVMIPTPGQPKTHYGIGAVNKSGLFRYHTGETFVLVRRHKRRREIAEGLQALVDKHPHEIVYVAWDNASTHADDEIEAVVRGAAGRLVLLYLPTYSPWLNPSEMLWREFRRDATHCELFESIKAVIAATVDFFQRCNARPRRVLSIIGSNAA